jgi:hypothetical protein
LQGFSSRRDSKKHNPIKRHKLNHLPGRILILDSLVNLSNAHFSIFSLNSFSWLDQFAEKIFGRSERILRLDHCLNTVQEPKNTTHKELEQIPLWP